MLNAHKAACLSGTQIFQTPKPIATELYRMHPRGWMARYLGCECANIAPLVRGVDDAAVRITTSCALHGRHPKEVPAYV